MYYLNVADSDAWLSLVERYVRDVEVAGSNPVASTFYESGDLLFPDFFVFTLHDTAIFLTQIHPAYPAGKKLSQYFLYL